jgi:purine-nucleoside phosphorylase
MFWSVGVSSLHIDATTGAIAPAVLLPGDPLRARFIAEKILSSPVEVTTRRNMLGYTGHYRGHRISVMGSGMGIPSCAIYATELARTYGVRQIIRIGTCGGIGDVHVGDILLAQAASSDSNFNRLQFGGHDLAPCADFSLLRAAAATAARCGVPVRMAHVFSTDCFYGGDALLLERLMAHHILGMDMETSGLYGVAMRENIQALSILTISDELPSGAAMPAEQREQGLLQVARLAMDSLLP